MHSTSCPFVHTEHHQIFVLQNLHFPSHTLWGCCNMYDFDPSPHGKKTIPYENTAAESPLHPDNCTFTFWLPLFVPALEQKLWKANKLINVHLFSWGNHVFFPCSPLSPTAGEQTEVTAADVLFLGGVIYSWIFHLIFMSSSGLSGFLPQKWQRPKILFQHQWAQRMMAKGRCGGGGVPCVV